MGRAGSGHLRGHLLRAYYRSGLNFSGEGGTVAIVAMRLLDGQRPIVDTFLGYNVMWFYPVAWLFKLTGPDYTALRIFFFRFAPATGVSGVFRRSPGHRQRLVLGAARLGTCADSGHALSQLHGIPSHVEHARAPSSLRFRATHEAQADLVDDRGGGGSGADLSHANRSGRLLHAHHGRIDCVCIPFG